MKAWLVERLQSFKTSYEKKKRKVSRWLKGQRFPPGFEEWFNQPQAPSGWTDEKLSTFNGPERFSSTQHAAKEFNHTITSEGSHWKTVTIGSNSSYGEWNLRFKSAQQRQDNQMSVSTTDIWELRCEGEFTRLCVNGLTAWHVTLQINFSEQPVRLEKCVIGKLCLQAKGEDVFRPILEIHDCWVGSLHLPKGCLSRLNVTGGGIARIDCPPADGPNPFKGAVSFANVFFPTASCQTGLFEGAQAYRSLHSHLKKHDNMLMANLMRSCQLRAERGYERGFAKFTNWVYGTFADYGRSPGRPLWWLLGLYVATFGIIYNCDGGTLMQPPHYYVGANASFLDENGGRLFRSLLLPLQSIVNALGVFFDARKMIVPTTTAGSVFLTIQGLVSDVLLLMTILSIRRRFKAD